MMRALVHKFFIGFLFLCASMGFAAESTEASSNNDSLLATPPPDDVYVLTKIDPQTAWFSLGLEGTWGFSNPFQDVYSFGFNVSAFPLSFLRLGLHGSKHWVSNTGLSESLDESLTLRDKQLRLSTPDFDLLGHLELRAFHGLVKIFIGGSIDFETGVFLRSGMRSYKNASLSKAWLIQPGIVQTVLWPSGFGLRIIAGPDIIRAAETFSLDNTKLSGGLEWRF